MLPYVWAKIRLFSFDKIIRWLNRQQFSESVALAVIAILVGLTSGIGVWLFKQLFNVIYRYAFEGIDTPMGLFHRKEIALRFFHDLANWAGFDKIGTALGSIGNWMIFFIPVIGGLAVGLISHFFIGKERYVGIAGIMESVALGGGRLPYRKIPTKTVAAALSIGSGASVGPADPSVQIGAYVGSMFGQLLRLSDERIRALVASGVAGGIAAAFNAPITGIFFALEIIIGELSVNAFGVVTLASVISSVFTQAVSGPQPAFYIPAYAFNSVWELPLYFGLGVLSGLSAAFYIRLHHFTRGIFDTWNAPRWFKPAVAGLAVGLVGMHLPQVFGIGYATIENILDGKPMTVTLLLSLALSRLVLTPICISSGFQGGVFAPALFSGATLGGAYGLVARQVFPSLNISPPAFAMVGMAAVLAGTIHAPITSFILLFEMTHDYRIILPLIAAVNVSLFLSWHLQHDSVYTLGLARKGIRLQRGRDVDVLETITVNEVMETEIVTLRESDSLTVATDLLTQRRQHGLPVLNNAGELTGIITVQDIDRAQDDDCGRVCIVGEICTRELLLAYSDETIGAALRRIGVRDVGQLPVVARKNPRHLVGLLRNTDIARAYDLAVTRRASMRHRAH
ncbi:MAG: chloride channel protein [Candidatus Brocadia sinica]|nr:chloride channel protein [Candidatus Brocadia sinica]NUO04084.1 chloride channel protein [Candidatus Brocadia sinica]